MESAKITAAIEEYVSDATTDYGILINGAWGIGKSHYARHVLLPALKGHGRRPGRGPHVVYLSLAGLKTREEFGSALLVAILDATDTKLARGVKGGLVGAILGVAIGIAPAAYGWLAASIWTDSALPTPGWLPALQSHWLAVTIATTAIAALAFGLFYAFGPTLRTASQLATALSQKISSGAIPNAIAIMLAKRKNVICCFDDLERAGDVIGAMSFLANFVEQTRRKLIVIAAENEINADEYARRKEKVIGRTLEFSPTVSDWFSTLLADTAVSADCRDFLKAHCGEIKRTLAQLVAPNLRSLREGFRCYEHVHAQIHRAGIMEESIHLTVLRLCIGIATESRADVNHIPALRMVTSPNFSVVTLYVHKRESGTNSATSEQERSQADYLIGFLAAYYPDWRDAPTYAALYRYVIDGWLDAVDLVADAKAQQQRSKTVLPNADAAFFNDFRSMPDGVFRERADYHLARLKAHEIVDFNTLYLVIVRLAFFASEGLLPISLTDLLVVSDTAVRRTASSGKFEATQFDRNDMAFRQNEIPDAALKRVCDLLFDTNDQFLDRQQVDGLRRMFDLAGSSAETFLDEFKMVASTSFAARPIFQACDPASLAGALGGFKNDELTEFGTIVAARYRVSAPHSPFIEELSALQMLSASLTEVASLHEGSLRGFHLKNVASLLEQARKKFAAVGT